ncbi:MAG: Fis family transcriptional regulator [Hyphomicrobium sp.]|nr:MAG: Fis family transcriptional regulator [Hyphomicrobium sp.]
MAHRLIWLIHYGKWPAKFVDHVNGDGLDNRLVNLRLASHAENNRNCRTYRSNTSGIKGVSFHRTWNKWQAHIQTDGKQRFLGSFKTKDEAAQAYREASKMYHGEFGRFE